MYCQVPNKENYQFSQDQDLPIDLQEILIVQGKTSDKLIKLFGQQACEHYQLEAIHLICLDKTLQQDLGLEHTRQYELPIFNNVEVVKGRYAGYQYQGQFAFGEIYGKGRLYNQNTGRLVYGYFGKDQIINVAAIDIKADVIYEGQFANDLKHGRGIYMDYENKVYYIGNFKNDKYDGEGQLKDEGRRNLYYKGGFLEGEYEGYGVLIEGEHEFRGEFQQGQRHGKGVQLDRGCKVYEGYFKQGKQHGLGKKYTKGEQLEYEGYFREGERHGYGKTFNVRGQIVEQGWFQNDVYKGYKRVLGQVDQEQHKAGIINLIGENQQVIMGKQLQESQVAHNLHLSQYNQSQAGSDIQ